jgi:thiol-disulfide isomerase/thioredoxin
MMIKRIGAMVILLSIITALKSQEPVFRLKDLDNQWKEYEDLKGDRLTVIDFWATWCQPCARSIPLLNEMAEEFDPQGVKFIGVSIDGTRNQSKIQPFIASMGVEYAIIRDIDSELMSELSVTAVPTLMVYDASGDLVYFHEGFKPGDEETIRNHIETFLDE